MSEVPLYTLITEPCNLDQMHHLLRPRADPVRCSRGGGGACDADSGFSGPGRLFSLQCFAVSMSVSVSLSLSLFLAPPLSFSRSLSLSLSLLPVLSLARARYLSFVPSRSLSLPRSPLLSVGLSLSLKPILLLVLSI